jgi:hypothetical protein
MNVQSAINAGLILEFVYNEWNKGGANGLDGEAVALSQPLTPPANYKVVKTLYCCDLATDIDPEAPGREGWKIIGILAVNVADSTDVVVAVRGTENVWEYIQDFKFFPRPFNNVPGAGLTDDGFTVMYESFSFTPSACGEPNFIQKLIAEIKGISPRARVTITGHSLGGPLVTLLALDLAAHANLPLAVYTFASPRTGDLTFHKVFDHTVLDCYRIVNRHDIVPQLPPPLLYFHVGDETELVPGPELKWGIHCEHHLTTYLHMLGKLLDPGGDKYPIDADCVQAVATAAKPAAIEPMTVEKQEEVSV